jgi:hypothetical protein
MDCIIINLYFPLARMYSKENFEPIGVSSSWNVFLRREVPLVGSFIRTCLDNAAIFLIFLCLLFKFINSSYNINYVLLTNVHKINV